MINSDQTAPDFTLPCAGGGDITLSDLRPNAVVLYFYPKDDTPGCTTQAVDFTALKDDFTAANATIVGISRDNIETHDKFILKHDLGIYLLSDTDGAVCENYGVWAEKTNFGRKYMGIVRTTFLIDGDGKITRIWRNVRARKHASEVLKAVLDR